MNNFIKAYDWLKEHEHSNLNINHMSGSLTISAYFTNYSVYKDDYNSIDIVDENGNRYEIIAENKEDNSIKFTTDQNEMETDSDAQLENQSAMVYISIEE